MEDTQLDAEQIKKEAVEAAKAALIQGLSGEKAKYAWNARGKDAPESYDELFDEVKKQTPTLTEEEVRQKAREEFQSLQKEQEDARKQADEAVKAQQETELELRRKSFDAEWYDLVQQGKMPAVAPELQERINKGESITQAEIEADEGLKSRLELAKIANGKSAKVAYYEDYKKQPAGADAPVLGTRPRTPQNTSEELNYDDVVKARKSMFGF